MTLKDEIRKIINENTLLGEFKAVPVTDLILTHTYKAVMGAVGEDDFQGCSWFDEFGYHGKSCDRPGGCTERLNRDELRAEIRHNIKQLLEIPLKEE